MIRGILVVAAIIAVALLLGLRERRLQRWMRSLDTTPPDMRRAGDGKRDPIPPSPATHLPLN
jgi:hypothetical protein